MKKGITIGMDLGDKNHQVSILDADGQIMERREVACNRRAVMAFFRQHAGAVVAMETGTHSRWVSNLAEAERLEVLVGNPRKLRAIWASRQKSDVRDADMLARIARFDRQLLYPIHHRNEVAHADLELIKARDLLVRGRANLIVHIRSVVKSWGARLPASSAAAFARKVQVPEALRLAVDPLLKVIQELSDKIRLYDQLIAEAAKQRYPETVYLSQVTGVGTLTALAYVLTLEDPGRFATSRMVGPYLGLTPRRDQSGQTDKQLRITKAGDGHVRRLLVGCAHYILGPFGPDTDLRRYGLCLAERGGKNAKRRAVVAVARKLAVLLHALWKSGARYEPNRKAA